ARRGGDRPGGRAFSRGRDGLRPGRPCRPAHRDRGPPGGQLALRPRSDPDSVAMSGDSRAARVGSSYAVHLGLLSVMWGSSYLFIKIGVETLPPLSLVALRVLVGFAVLLVVVAATRTPLPRDLGTLGHLAVLGAVNIAIPFWL